MVIVAPRLYQKENTDGHLSYQTVFREHPSSIFDYASDRFVHSIVSSVVPGLIVVALGLSSVVRNSIGLER